MKMPLKVEMKPFMMKAEMKDLEEEPRFFTEEERRKEEEKDKKEKERHQFFLLPLLTSCLVKSLMCIVQVLKEEKEGGEDAIAQQVFKIS